MNMHEDEKDYLGSANNGQAPEMKENKTELCEEVVREIGKETQRNSQTKQYQVTVERMLT